VVQTPFCPSEAKEILFILDFVLSCLLCNQSTLPRWLTTGLLELFQNIPCYDERISGLILLLLRIVRDKDIDGLSKSLGRLHYFLVSLFEGDIFSIHPLLFTNIVALFGGIYCQENDQLTFSPHYMYRDTYRSSRIIHCLEDTFFDGQTKIDYISHMFARY
jgi:hypothetical protein